MQTESESESAFPDLLVSSDTGFSWETNLTRKSRTLFSPQFLLQRLLVIRVRQTGSSPSPPSRLVAVFISPREEQLLEHGLLAPSPDARVTLDAAQPSGKWVATLRARLAAAGGWVWQMAMAKENIISQGCP